jgi:hypothetical protein
MIGEAPGALETGGLGALSLDGTLLARGTTDGQAWLYEVAETGLTRVPMPQGESAGVQRGFAFSADNRLLAAGGDDTRAYAVLSSSSSKPRRVSSGSKPSS